MEHSITTEDVLLSTEDKEAIERAVLDYVDGWYQGDSSRMERALHPDLVKRTIELDRKKNEWVLGKTSTAPMMVRWTGQGGGTGVPPAERKYEITILDVFRHVAMVKAVSPLYVDYCQLLRFDESWKIVNVLWEIREGEVEAED
jgi:hypothetical protein